MATYYWVGGTGTWDNSSTANWSTTSGGSSGAGPPTSTDDVVFDANSNLTAGIKTCTLGTGATCNNYSNSTGVSSQVMQLSGTVAAYGNWTSTNAGHWTVPGATNTLNYSPTTSVTLSESNPPQNLNLSGSGTVTLGVAINYASVSIVHTAGTFDTGGYAVTASSFASTGTTTRTINLNASTLTLRAANFWTISGTNATLNAGTSTIIGGSTSLSRTFAGGGKTYYILNPAYIGSGNTFSITGSNTFTTLHDTDSHAHTLQFASSSTQTVTNFTVSGTSGNVISLRSSSTGTRFNLSKSSGTVSRDYLDIKDSNATGGATWNAGTSSTDSGNNAGWVFTTPVVVSLSESATSSDTVNVSLTTSPSISESITTTDTNSTASTYPVTTSESVAATDTNSVAVTWAATISESVTPSDTVSGGNIYSLSISESGVASETIATGAITFTSLSELFSSSDAISVSVSAAQIGSGISAKRFTKREYHDLRDRVEHERRERKRKIASRTPLERAEADLKVAESSHKDAQVRAFKTPSLHNLKLLDAAETKLSEALHRVEVLRNEHAIEQWHFNKQQKNKDRTAKRETGADLAAREIARQQAAHAQQAAANALRLMEIFKR